MIKTKPFIFGIAGFELSAEEKEFFLNNPCVGFIIFTRNIRNKEQLKNLITELKGLYEHHSPIIFIDQEGGRVARLRDPLISKNYPSAETLSENYHQDKEEVINHAQKNFFALMSELQEFGIDSPCAPNCDLLHDESHKIVIGDRSFGRDIKQVIDLSKAAIKGIKEACGIPWIKHIPGHGRAHVDSHFDLPHIDAPLEELEATDFAIFKELAPLVDWGMTAHIIYNQIDPKHVATCSKAVISYIREKIGFIGKLVTDDICMLALHGEIGKLYQILVKFADGTDDSEAKLRDYFAANNHPFIHDKELDQKYCSIKYTFQTLDNTALLSDHESYKELFALLRQQYLQSISNVAISALEAGCDIVLHCSGDINEMQIILKRYDSWTKHEEHDYMVL